ncbi:MAG: hypothetical protein HUU23_08690 [Caldilineales bacterium]|nr:hypothetical protein [Caldilineales bacterium]
MPGKGNSGLLPLVDIDLDSRAVENNEGWEEMNKRVLLASDDLIGRGRTPAQHRCYPKHIVHDLCEFDK